jgi:hypothetical protein
MKNLIFFAAFIGLGSSACFADDWTGKLLDENCVKQEMAQKAPEASLPAMDQACPASGSTKMFAVEVSSGEILRLNPAGNAKAADAMKKAKPGENVTINGTRRGGTIDVTSIDLMQ